MDSPERAVLIDAVLARRNFTPTLRRRIERLLDGEEDRRRLHCCNSGCFVCVQELLAVVVEVEAKLAQPDEPGNPAKTPKPAP